MALPYVAHQVAGAMVLAAMRTCDLVKIPPDAWYCESSTIVAVMPSATLGLSKGLWRGAGERFFLGSNRRSIAGFLLPLFPSPRASLLPSASSAF